MDVAKSLTEEPDLWICLECCKNWPAVVPQGIPRLALNKIERLQAHGMTFREMVLEKADAATVTVDRWGKVTWNDSTTRMNG